MKLATSVDPVPADVANAPAPTRRTVLVLGSTGSIGTQALDVIEVNPDGLGVAGIAAGGRDLALIANQVLSHAVPAVAISRAGSAEDFLAALTAEADRRGLSSADYRRPRVLVGPEAVRELIESTPADIVLNGIDGDQGLAATLTGLATGARLALANKESLIAGGPLVLRAAAPGQLVPVDSEHSALAQCLRGGRAEEVAKLTLTASGGPFRGRTKAELAGVTVADALAHPTWSMGQLVTINSATLVNKGLEVIEAHLLFGVPYERLGVVVHPQSIVHSMVTFHDGSTLAQASPPTMKIPIALALSWPDRLVDIAPACDFSQAQSWTFEPLDQETFPAVSLAIAAGSAGGSLPAVFNAANEEAVGAFVAGSLPFTGIVDTIRAVVDDAAAEWGGEPADVDEVLAALRWARARTRERVATAATDGNAR
ncbi:MAG TPA: 1-deoxy-D-xylulose-5-phosphate reductoisomerase [Pseudonocardiaceae bacterium]|jgi:1-deoxy-D-xylulose-5-phosphate reductoisomerase|nr:1-deoxy-D-xylulose-5-phosphate reductoisomerase [Pseudonocardiaceae bacterium]